MSSATSMSVPQKRSFRLDPRADGNAVLSVSGDWYGGNPFATQLLNAYTLLIPNGERFIIRICQHYLNRVMPQLKEELEGLFFQEGAHSREHRRVLELMQADGLGMKVFRSIVEWLSYSVVEPLTPRKLRLATAAAIEHHNAVIATYFLNRNLLEGIYPKELRRLFLWHFSEEIEHKETVFKLLQTVSRSGLLKALGLFLSFSTFLLYTAVGVSLLGLRTRSAFRKSFWTEGFRSKGLFAALAKESWRYLRPGFHPSLDESRTLLDSSLAALERLEVKRPNVPFPPMFQTKVRRTVERCQDVQSKYPFFFSRIEDSAGAWVRSEGVRKLNFCTYSYLGLLHHPQIDDAARKAIDRYGTGTHGVRLLGGNLEIHEQLEASIAAFFRRDAAITFSSGFMTNLAVVGSLVGKGDYVLSDELNHASIVDGCRFSGASVINFRHNDMTDLACKLGGLPENSRKLIVVDAVFSMDGDIAPLPALMNLRNGQPNTILMVDEAHSLGVLGTHGRGIEEHFDCPGEIDVLMGTLSKTIPCQGGYIAGRRDLITHLRYNARGFIFSAALSPVAAAAAQAAFGVIENEGEVRRLKLLANVHYFMLRLRAEGFDVGRSETAIVPVLLGSEARAFAMARQCNQEGIYVMPVVYPAVLRGAERLRMNVTCDHAREDLDYAVQVLVHARSTVVDAR